MTIFLVCDPSRMQVFAPWTGLLVWSAMRELVRDQLNDLPATLTALGGYGIRCWLVVKMISSASGNRRSSSGVIRLRGVPPMENCARSKSSAPSPKDSVARIDEGFETILQNMQPTPGLFAMAKAMFVDAWETRRAEAQGAKKAVIPTALWNDLCPFP